MDGARQVTISGINRDLAKFGKVRNTDHDFPPPVYVFTLWYLPKKLFKNNKSAL